MIRIFLVLLTLAVAAQLSACNTVNGIGQDLRSAGDTLSGASR